MAEISRSSTPDKIFEAELALGDFDGGPRGPKNMPREAQELLRLVLGGHSMAHWISTYIKDTVAGIQAANTLRAKTGDLAGFAKWMVEMTGQAEITDWLPRDTQGYLRHLEQQKRAPASINRVYASIRRFARWAQEQPGGVFVKHGLPIRGITGLAVGEPDCKKLSNQDVNRLLRAADRLVNTPGVHRTRARRNRAILITLLHTGLRVSELIALQLYQLQGKHLVNVARKGRARTKAIYLTNQCREVVNDYLKHERIKDDPHGDEPFLFLSAYGTGRLDPTGVNRVLKEIAKEASKNLAEPIYLHAHRLRHTFGFLHREQTGSDTETAAALGHTGLAHVKRYVRKTEQERAEDLEIIYGKL